MLVTGQTALSGGVLIEITDEGLGIPEQELAYANWRLDSPPVIDVAVSRRMGLFVVGRLAARHGIRVRLRRAESGGLSALIWVPETVAETEPMPPLGARRRFDVDGYGQGTSRPVQAPGMHAPPPRAAPRPRPPRRRRSRLLRLLRPHPRPRHRPSRHRQRHLSQCCLPGQAATCRRERRRLPRPPRLSRPPRPLPIRPGRNPQQPKGTWPPRDQTSGCQSSTRSSLTGSAAAARPSRAAEVPHRPRCRRGPRRRTRAGRRPRWSRHPRRGTRRRRAAQAGAEGQPVPGSAGSKETESSDSASSRSPETMRERMAKFQQGVREGRAAASQDPSDG